MDTAELASVSSEAGLLVDALRAKGVHAALSFALLDLYEQGGRSGFHPSELLNELLSLFGQPRAPPVLSTLKLPLRQKDEFVNAIIAANLDGALRQGLIALECVGLRAGLLLYMLCASWTHGRRALPSAKNAELARWRLASRRR